MRQVHFWWSIVLLFMVTGCYVGDAVVVETREPAVTIPVVQPTREIDVSVAAVLGATITPTPTPLLTFTPTAVPTSTLAPKPSSTPTATWLPVLTPMATADPEKIPQMVWLQYEDGSYTDPPTVLAVRSGVAAYEEFPIEITSFWDYSPVSGRVVFSNAPQHGSPYGDKSVTDLWVYNYETGQAEMWFEDNVGSAAWSSTIHPQTETELLAVAVYNENHQYDLLLLSEPGNVIATIPNASPHFSWSPDGQWIAFFQWPGAIDGIYVVDVLGGNPTKVAPLDWVRSVYDRPLWAQEHQAIIESTGVLKLWFMPYGAGVVEFPEGRSPYNMLWDPATRQLLVGFEGGMDSPEEVKVFQLSEDMKTIVREYVLGGARLADWIVPGEKLLLSDGQIIEWPVERP